jgi:hypothetical protein
MIVRYSRGWMRAQNADRYEAIVATECLPSSAARGAAGYYGTYLLRRTAVDKVESAT